MVEALTVIRATPRYSDLTHTPGHFHSWLTPGRENQLMTSKHLIDPELLQVLEQMPSLETSSETL
jgi:hypothetical protein